MPDSSRGLKRKRRRREEASPDVDAFIGGAKTVERSGLDDALDALSPAGEEEAEPIKVFNLRLPATLHAKLDAVAAATGRSMHDVAMTLLEPALDKAYERYAE